MAYVKNTWVDQQGQVRYTETEDDGYKIFTANYEEVTEIGTPVNADNMNHIEDGIAENDAAITTINGKIPSNATSLNKMVTQLDLNGKADVDLTNVNNSGTSLGASWAMPSGTYIDLTLGADGSTYTAPANGWFAIQKYNDSTIGDGYIAMVNLSNQLAIENRQIRYAGSGGMPIGRVYIPAKKGDSVGVYYDITGSVITFRFIYAVGSESEAS